jgi:hypothetical protein
MSVGVVLVAACLAAPHVARSAGFDASLPDPIVTPEERADAVELAALQRREAAAALERARERAARAHGVDEADVVAWTMFVSEVAPQLGANGLGALPAMGVSIRWLKLVEPEITAGYGLFLGGYTKLRLSVGAKLVLPIDRVRPFLWGAYSHVHETKVTAMLADPWGTVSTTSKAVGHRSGVELGLGAMVPIPIPLGADTFEVDMLVRGGVMFLPRLDEYLPMVPAHGGAEEQHDGYAFVDLAIGFPLWS